MKHDAKARVFRAKFPWLNSVLPPIAGDYEFYESTVDAETFELEPQRTTKSRILLLDRDGSELTRVRLASGFMLRGPLCWPWTYAPTETVGRALARLGIAAHEVNFILVTGTPMCGPECATVYHTRGNVKIVDLFLKEVAKEEARIRDGLEKAFEEPKPEPA